LTLIFRGGHPARRFFVQHEEPSATDYTDHTDRKHKKKIRDIRAIRGQWFSKATGTAEAAPVASYHDK
jgi:hypothetical protein